MWTKGQRMNFSSTVGSFGEQFYGSKIYLGNGHWESVTKAYLFRRENDFYFNNPYHENYYTNLQPVREKQQGAAIENKGLDRKSTRLNSSHVRISYAVFCLKK